MNHSFTIKPTPKLCFGCGRILELPDLLAPYGKKLLILTGKRSFISGKQWPELNKRLIEQGFSLDLAHIEHEPSPENIDRIVEKSSKNIPDAVIAIGGGSVLDAGKAVSAMLVEQQTVVDFLEGVGTRQPSGQKVPFIAVPTTAGTGSEATSNGVVSSVGRNGFKKSLRHDNYVPDIALIDPELALDCPESVTFSCGMDTFSQLLEAYLSTNGNPLTDSLALEGITRVIPALDVLSTNCSDLQARSAMAYGSYLSGIVLANAGLGLVHGYASAIGGFHDIPHGVVCGTLMAESNRITLEKLRDKKPDSPALTKYSTLGKLIESHHTTETAFQDCFISYLAELTEKLQIPPLGDYGVREKDLPTIIEKSSCKYNPTLLTESEMTAILRSRLTNEKSFTH